MTPLVYFVKPGDQNEELRYSLRSLTNVPHGDVWVVGHKPKWVRDVGYLPVEAPKTRTHWEQVTAALTAACESAETPDEFALYNDDFFALEPTEIPLWHKGPADRSILRYGRATNWKAGLAATIRLLDSWNIDPVLDYEIHVPMVVEKERMAEALARAKPHRIVALQRRILYGNLYQVGGEYAEDVGIGDQTTIPPPGQVWVATNDQSFATGKVGEFIRNLFPNPSPYERS